MTRMTGPDCAVMGNLINTNTDKSCRRDVGNGGDLGGKRKKRRRERVFDSVAADILY